MDKIIETKSILFLMRKENDEINENNNYLIRVCETSHTRHNTENIVVGGIHANLGGVGGVVVGDCGGSEGELEGGVVNAREIAGSAGLVLLGLKGKRVDVDTSGGDILVVLVGLHQVEVASLTLVEAVMAVQLELAN
jgi:hypothetical protein